MILALPLLIEYLCERNFRSRKVGWNITAFALIPAALLAFAFLLKLKFGNWTVMFDVQSIWGRHLMWPWHPLAWFLRHAPPLSPEHHDKLDFGFLLVLLGAAVAGLRRLRISYSAYSWTAVVFFSCWGTLGSIPRFDLVIFPLFIVLAFIGARNRAFHLGYVVASSMLAALFMVMHSQWNWLPSANTPQKFFRLAFRQRAAEALYFMRTEETLRALDDLICERSILQHPFYRAWQRGELTRDQLATYSRVYYPHVAAFPTYLQNAISCAEDSSTRRTLQDNLLDELTNPAPHPELWLDFATATGQDRNKVKRATPLAKVASATSTFDRLTSQGTASGLTALYAYESQQPEVAAEKMRGLHEFYGIKSSEALSYFAVHATADLEHRAAERAALARCLDAGTSPSSVMKAAEEALDAYWNLLDSVCEEADVELTEALP